MLYEMSVLTDYKAKLHFPTAVLMSREFRKEELNTVQNAGNRMVVVMATLFFYKSFTVLLLTNTGSTGHSSSVKQEMGAAVHQVAVNYENTV